MYGLLLVGKYTFFEKILVIFVSIMGLSFLVSLFLVYPQPKEVIQGLIPSITQVPGGKLMVAAFVGTTMAAATFLSRPLFVQGKGWGIQHLNQQKKDAIIAAILVFAISGAVMAVASGALYHQGKTVTQVLDMANTLEPIAGRFATTLFFFWNFKRRAFIHISMFIDCAIITSGLSIREVGYKFKSIQDHHGNSLLGGFNCTDYRG